MQISGRRKEILNIFLERGLLSYEDILEEMTGFGDDEDILSDIDNLIFFRFLQHLKDDMSRLELRSVTKEQMKNDPQRVFSRLTDIKNEIPPWYRKLAILSVLNENQPADSGEILNTLKVAFPHVKWSPQLVQTSLRMLKTYQYVTKANEKFTLSDQGKYILAQSPLEKSFALRELGDEYTSEFRTMAILDIVKKHEKSSRGISCGKINALLQTEYGERGNRRRAIRNTLDNMVFTGLLEVSRDNRGLRGGTYTLGNVAKSLFGIVSPRKLSYFEYDIAISFAGEDREVARDLARALRIKGVKSFFDEYYKEDLWGKKLTKYFRDVYGRKTGFVVLLISKYYPVKIWTDFEFSIMREEAEKRETEFILPVKLDNTKMLGLHDDVGYLDYEKERVDGIVDCVLKKLSRTVFDTENPGL